MPVNVLLPLGLCSAASAKAMRKTHPRELGTLRDTGSRPEPTPDLEPSPAEPAQIAERQPTCRRESEKEMLVMMRL